MLDFGGKMTININKNNSAFLFIDFQEKLVGMLRKNICEKKANILAQTAKILGIKTIVTEQYPQGLGATTLLIKQNLPEDTKFFEKTSFSAFETEGFSQNLSDIENIFVFGIETHICVFQTVLDLIQKTDLKVFVVKDACASRETEEFKTAINFMEKEGAKIITTEMVVFEMLKTSKNPNFKEIQALIK